MSGRSLIVKLPYSPKRHCCHWPSAIRSSLTQIWTTWILFDFPWCSQKAALWANSALCNSWQSQCEWLLSPLGSCVCRVVDDFCTNSRKWQSQRFSKTERETCWREVRAKLWVAGSAISMISKHRKTQFKLSNTLLMCTCICTCVCVCGKDTCAWVCTSNAYHLCLPTSSVVPSHDQLLTCNKTGVVFHAWPHVGGEVWRGIWSRCLKVLYMGTSKRSNLGSWIVVRSGKQWRWCCSEFYWFLLVGYFCVWQALDMIEFPHWNLVTFTSPNSATGWLNRKAWIPSGKIAPFRASWLPQWWVGNKKQYITITTRIPNWPGLVVTWRAVSAFPDGVLAPWDMIHCSRWGRWEGCGGLGRPKHGDQNNVVQRLSSVPNTSMDQAEHIELFGSCAPCVEDREWVELWVFSALWPPAS